MRFKEGQRVKMMTIDQIKELPSASLLDRWDTNYFVDTGREFILGQLYDGDEPHSIYGYFFHRDPKTAWSHHLIGTNHILPIEENLEDIFCEI